MSTPDDQRNHSLGNAKLFGNLHLLCPIGITARYNDADSLRNFGTRASRRWSVATIPPKLVTDYVSNLRSVHPILSGQACVTHLRVFGVTPANGSDLFPTQFGHAVRLASARVAAAFVRAIVPVGFVVAKKQMIRAHARRIVAAVQDKLAGWNRSNRKQPGSPMSGNAARCSTITTAGNAAVIPLIPFAASPVPTLSNMRDVRWWAPSFVNLGPEALWKRAAQALCRQIGLSNFEAHTFSCFECVTRSGVLANRRGTSILARRDSYRKGEISWQTT